MRQRNCSLIELCGGALCVVSRSYYNLSVLMMVANPSPTLSTAGSLFTIRNGITALSSTSCILDF